MSISDDDDMGQQIEARSKEISADTAPVKRERGVKFIEEKPKTADDAEVSLDLEEPSRSEVPFEADSLKTSDSKEKIVEDEHVEEDLSTLYEFPAESKRLSDELDAESCICSDDSSVFLQSADPGVIDLAFPENPECELIEKHCLPASYYTLSGKEKLILMYAENFRKQFLVQYPHRKPPVLAVRNECGVQKFVSQTIRPTTFIIPKLIGCLEEIARFVADFIVYEPLQNPISLPPRLISPDWLLRTRCGNSFEMATLLCSMLIGAGFPAVVVSGIARSETTKNDQREVECSFVPVDNIPDEEDSNEAPVDTSKYALREPPDLTSHLQEHLDRIAEERERESKKSREEEERLRQEQLDMLSDDRLHGRRLHAWVAVIENAPWGVKPREKKYDEDGKEIKEPPSAFFIEPSTGIRHEVKSKYFMKVDSIWNNFNYYVNRQEGHIKEMRWDLSNTADWEHFLPGEPPELRVKSEASEEFLNEDAEDNVWIEKHLDLIPSWVQKLHIGLPDFEERYPGRIKTIHYKNAIYERYSPYSKIDGKVKQLTKYEDDYYKIPTLRWEYFENRKDLLEKIKLDFINKQVEESFKKGREEKLKYYKHSVYKEKPMVLYFNHLPRFDSLRQVEIKGTKIMLHFHNRRDFCFYQEFEINEDHQLVHMIDKFRRNPALPPSKDIAMRHFYLKEDKIFLKFHYAKGAVTASTREFLKPPKPGYGEEITFDPACTKGYNANPLDPPPTQVELYFLLLKQLKEEERLKKEYSRRVSEFNAILDKRKREMKSPQLLFSIFDPLRNEGARQLRMKEYEAEKARKRAISLKDPDFLAPYLVPYRDRKPDREESRAAYNACMSDLKTRYIGLLNELQRKYEDLTAEAKALKRFLDKFQNQFDDYDYHRLLKEKKDIELNKRMVQQRLNLTHDEAQKKYEKVKEALLADIRLNLGDDFPK